MSAPSLSRIVGSLPAIAPFMPPEVLERKAGMPFELRLGANESRFGPSPRAIASMRNALEDSWMYPDGTCHDVRQTIANHLGISPDNILVGAGIDGLLGLIARQFLDVGDMAVTSLGSYPTFEYAVAGAGGVLRKVRYGCAGPDIEALKGASVGGKMIYLANPDNPSGALQSPPTISEFVRELPEGAVILLDEAYAEFAPEITPIEEFLADRRVLRLRTFSKIHGLAGMRIGYAVGHPETLEPLNRIRMHFEVSRAAHAGAIASLLDGSHAEMVYRETEAGRARYEEIAGDLGMRALASATNFVAIDTGSHERAMALLNELRNRSVFIRMPWAEPLNSCIRVSVGTREEQERFGEVLQDVVRAGF